MAFILIWYATIQVSVAPEPSLNPWTGEDDCQVYYTHYKMVRKPMSKEFATHAEARKFYDKAPENYQKRMHLHDIKTDVEVKI